MKNENQEVSLKLSSQICRWKTLAAVSSVALAVAMGPVAYAQDNSEGATGEEEVLEGEEIVVTGFRHSLKTAQDLKQNADTFLDAITAEDIGALPDRSVAESLQRVPGVNIGRFEKTTDPDRFSVEGTGVIVRGLPFVRSELNGREIFSATGGRVLSFNDVSPELLGSVQVIKNNTADMVEGGIAGTVNLVTRKPLDNAGLKIAGTIAGNYGDLREKWSPEISGLISNSWETDAGTLGLQFGYASSELESRTDASQVTDPCYRSDALDAGCFRVQNVSSGGFGGDSNFDSTTFPPAGTVVVPKGAGVRTTDLLRDREAISFVGQWESPDQKWLATVEWLNSETSFETEEFSILALVNDDNFFPIQATGSTWEFDNNGVFQNGVLTQEGAGFGFGGIPTEFLRFERATEGTTEDVSFDLSYSPTDRLRFNFEAQRISSDLERSAIIGAMQSYSDIDLDLRGGTPQVQFLPPSFAAGAPADVLSNEDYSLYWFALDSEERNDAKLTSFKFDGEYDIDKGFIKSARFGARWADRDRVTRNTNFSTWGNLSAPWSGRAGCAAWGLDNSFQPCTPEPNPVTGQFGAYVPDFPGSASFRNPFGDGFQRGNAPTPTSGGGWFFGGDDFLGEYLAGITDGQVDEIANYSTAGNHGVYTYGVRRRLRTDPITGEEVQCDPFCPGEISDVGESTQAFYGRLDFGHEFDAGLSLEGNVGIRYVETTIDSSGYITLPAPQAFDRDGDGVVQVSEIQDNCTLAATSLPPGQSLPGYCSLSGARLSEFAAVHTGEVIVDSRDIEFNNWLPSLNAKLDFGNGWLLRGAISKGISRPDLNLFQAGAGIGDNTNTLRSEGTLETGPLFATRTGNRNLQPVEATNYDFSVEWYWDDVGSLTASAFWKDINGFINNGSDVVNYVSPDGTSFDLKVDGPVNSQDGTLSGFEISYQQTYDMLPGLLSGLGSQFTYTYVDGGDFSNPTLAGFGQASVANGSNELNVTSIASDQPLAGISKNTVNATIFYEQGPVALRAAYNWRDEFLITPRDDIFPFSPIWQEATGQLDASAFYEINDRLTVGVQGVNLLDEVTETSQVVDFDGTRLTRSAFRNDRRFTILGRFTF